MVVKINIREVGVLHEGIVFRRGWSKGRAALRVTR
jgi:hypothetical protein